MTLFKRPDSDLWWYEFVVAGKRYRASTKTANKRDAADVETARRREVLEDQNRARLGIKRVTLWDTAQKWLESSAASLSDHANNQSRVRKLFGSELRQSARNEWVLHEGVRAGLPKTLMVHEITQEVLMELRTKRTAEGNSAATINREMSLVQSLMGFAQAMNVVMPEKQIVWTQRRNRAASLKMKEPKGKLRWLTRQEEMALLARLAEVASSRKDDQGSLDNWHLTMFLLDTGARYNEVAKIKWDCVDLDAGLIYLYRSKVDNESGIRLTKRTLEMLKVRKEMTWPRSHVFPALEKVGFTKSVFAPGDEPRGHATAAIQSAIDEVGLNNDLSKGKVTPHTFRDTFASRLVQAGVSLLKVSHLLGHADESMTKKYAHLCPDSTGREAVAILDGMHG